MIKAVLFDYGGVLTEAGRASSIGQIISEFYGLDLDWRELDDLHSRFRRGLITPDEFFNELARKHRSTKRFTIQEWHAVSHAVFGRSKPVYELAAQLRAHGIRTGILSNVYRITADELRAAGNYDGFDPVILSCDEGLAKPDKAIFELAIERVGVSGPEILFIDDQEKSLPVAQSLGIKTVLAKEPKQIVADVKALLKTENDLTL